MSVKVEFNTKVWESLLKKVSTIDKARVHVGVIGNSGGYEDEISVPEVAAIHEFGLGNVPERSFVRSTIAEQRDEIVKTSNRIIKGILDDKLQPAQGMALLGEFVAVKIKNKITTGEGVPPPLQPETIARKGSDRPLVDTGQLLNAISYEVDMTGGSGE